MPGGDVGYTAQRFGQETIWIQTHCRTKVFRDAKPMGKRRNNRVVYFERRQ